MPCCEFQLVENNKLVHDWEMHEYLSPLWMERYTSHIIVLATLKLKLNLKGDEHTTIH